VIVHAAVLAWLAHDPPGPRGTEQPAAARPPVPAPSPTPHPPVEIVLLDARALAHVERAAMEPGARLEAATERAPRAGSTRASGSRPDVGDGDAGAGGDAVEPPGRSPLMTMRRPGGDAPSGLSGTFLEDFLARSKPLPPPADIPGERIGDEIADVRAKLKRASRHDGAELGGLRHELVMLNAQRAAEELKPAGGGTYQTEKETFRAKVAADGSVSLEDRPEQLDTQDRMMLRRGIDPYARNKLAYLDRTRDQRVALGTRHRRAQLARAPQLVQQQVDRLWATTPELAARKQGLFELWDDCAEVGTDELVAAGAAARAFVVGVIRARLRGADAYTAAELARLNARRRSRAVFAPYE